MTEVVQCWGEVVVVGDLQRLIGNGFKGLAVPHDRAVALHAIDARLRRALNDALIRSARTETADGHPELIIEIDDRYKRSGYLTTRRGMLAHR